ncbi:sialin-like [Strongylocentrotus purpuratus]|uniref:Major facilitator superfamily (MFS) profile domain-containing protein n=1 Tax=Strongylocentrotus purpuratus TaxID=7668 RepID=A0A7M7STA2_STRPU|nr:sialin-like [Strongylocentrotus purpuratus]
MTKGHGEQTTDESLSTSTSMSIPSRYPSISETMATKKDGSKKTDYGSLPLEASEQDRKTLLGPSKENIPGFIQVRHQMAILIFLGMTAVCAMRQNVSVAMVAMVNGSYVTYDEPLGNESLEGVETCSESLAVNSTTEQTSSGEFLWDTQTQELLLAGFFYGYIFTQIPGGWLSDKFGMKWVLGFGFLLSSVCTLLGPVAAYAGTEWYFVTRFFSGLGEGVSFPSLLAMWSKWAHPEERSSLSVIGFVGFNSGNVLGNALTGYLINLDVIGGWPLPFYVFGTVGCLWFILWSFVAYSSPREHPWISKEEREYLEEGLKHSNTLRPSIPWRSILSSPAMWCQVFTHFPHTLGMFTLLVNLPLYYSEALNVPIELAGIYSALPYALQFVVMLVFSYISDALFARRILSKVATRKLMAAIGFGSGAFFLILTGFSRCNTALSVTFLTLAMGGVGISFSGHFVALLDIAGPFAGSAMGMMNTAGTLGGIIGPYIVGVLTEIQKVMWIVAGFYGFGGLTFIIFGTVELQHWAKQDYQAIPDSHGDE